MTIDNDVEARDRHGRRIVTEKIERERENKGNETRGGDRDDARIRLDLSSLSVDDAHCIFR